METWQQMKAEKNKKPRQSRLEVAEASWNRLKPFKQFHTHFVF